MASTSAIDSARVIAEQVDMPWEKCEVVWGDTSKGVAWSSVQAGSQTTYAHTRANYAAGQALKPTLQELAAVGHGHRIVSDGERAAGRVVGGDNEVLPVGPDTGVAAPGLGGAGNRFRVFEPDNAQVLVAAGIIVHRTGGDGWVCTHSAAPSVA